MLFFVGKIKLCGILHGFFKAFSSLKYPIALSFEAWTDRFLSGLTVIYKKHSQGTKSILQSIFIETQLLWLFFFLNG